MPQVHECSLWSSRLVSDDSVSIGKLYVCQRGVEMKQNSFFRQVQVGSIVLSCMAWVLIFNLAVAQAKEQSARSDVSFVALAEKQIVLQGCDLTPDALCVASFGRVDDGSLVTLQSPVALPSGLGLQMDGQPFACKVSPFDSGRMYCTGPLILDGTWVHIEVLSPDNRLITFGTLMVKVQPIALTGQLETSGLYPYLYMYNIFIPNIFNIFQNQ